MKRNAFFRMGVATLFKAAAYSVALFLPATECFFEDTFPGSLVTAVSDATF